MVDRTASDLQVGLLGSFEVTVAGRPVLLPRGRGRALLAVLAMDPGLPVTVETLAQRVWGARPPQHVRASVHTVVRRLRSRLPPESIGFSAGGYVLKATAEQVDVARFRRLAEAEPSDPSCAEKLWSAIRLWRGVAFTGVDSEDLYAAEVPALADRYLSALERVADLSLVGPRFPDPIEVTELTQRIRAALEHHPLRESLWVRHLRLLDLTGRRAEALAAYEDVRRSLADELGVGPGAELRAVFADLLGDPEDLEDAGRRSGAATRPVPPSAPSTFVGRTDALAGIDELIASGEQAPVVVVSGAAGVGKTALVLHWAHLHYDKFPDGVVYVDLRGFDPNRRPMALGEALRLVLAELGVDAQQVPSDVHRQLTLYRSTIAERRLLVVLDNARDADQVRPLLPPRTAAALVTSRDQLFGVVSREGASTVRLGPLSGEEARDLLRRRLGARRVGAEDGAVAEIIETCDRLPMALSLVAARAATNPAFRLSDLADELRPESGRLDNLSGPDEHSSVRAAIRSSYLALGPEDARVFRLLGLHRVAEISLAATASLAGVTLTEASSTMARLAAASLVEERRPQRYVQHDLVRLLAVDLLGASESPEAKRRAALGVLGHYLATAREAAMLMDPQQYPISLLPMVDQVVLDRVTSYDEALAWFTAMHESLLEVAWIALTTGYPEYGWRLVWCLVDYADRRAALWWPWANLAEHAVVVLAAAGDDAGVAQCHRLAGQALARLEEYDRAHEHFALASEGFERIGDDVGRSYVLRNDTWTCAREGRFAEAVTRMEKLLELFTGTGDEAGLGRAMNSMGWYLVHLGDLDRALATCLKALEHAQTSGDRPGEADTWDSLALAYQRLGRLEDALAAAERAAEQYEALGDHASAARSGLQAGDLSEDLGDRSRARAAWQQALVVVDNADPEIRATLTQRLEGAGG
ncbi:BTAD domain-containing putative transcriptional regulator [Nocardioides sp. NPDC101246]|uniref:AfsR/SARP family transcriptional regulator n=1 Tax=Nocardioides sp. NPDC101246 TaxID=3364336 RepID=UPI003814DCDE